MIELDLKNRTPKELNLLKEQIMISDLTVADKDKLINQIESSLGIKYSRTDVLLMIEEGKADYDDLVD